MPKKPERTWVLAADSARARVYAVEGPDKQLVHLEHLDLAYDHRQAREIGSSKPGRVQESAYSGRHAIEPHTDPVREEERRFAHSVTKSLGERLGRGDFQRLIIVAPPTALGDLRAAMPAPLRKVVGAEIHKDLVHGSLRDLRDHLVKAAAL